MGFFFRCIGYNQILFDNLESSSSALNSFIETLEALRAIRVHDKKVRSARADINFATYMSENMSEKQICANEVAPRPQNLAGKLRLIKRQNLHFFCFVLHPESNHSKTCDKPVREHLPLDQECLNLRRVSKLTLGFRTREATA